MAQEPGPGGTIGTAFVGVLPDLASFASTLTAGIRSAMRGVRIDAPATQLELPGLESAAKNLIGSGIQAGFTEGTQLALPGMERLLEAEVPSLFQRVTSAISATFTETVPTLMGNIATGVRSFGSAVADLGTRVTGTFEQVDARLQDSVLGSVQRIGNGIVGAVDRAQGAIGTSLSNAILHPLAGIAQTGAGILAAVLGGGIVVGLEAGAQLDRLRKSFTDLTGSAQAAQDIIQSLRETTITTGQDFSQLASSTQQLITAGFNPDLATSVLDSVSKMVTVYGRGIQGLQRASIQLEEIGFRGTVQAQQLNALIRDGIPGYQALTVAAENLGLAQEGSATATQDAKDAMKAGQITAEAFFQALSDPRVIGNVNAVMGAIQTNVAFQMTQLRNITTHILAQVMEPVQNVIGAALRPLTNQLDTLANSSDLLNSLGTKISEGFKPVIPLFQRFADALGSIIKSAESGGIDSLVSQLQPLANAMAVIGGMVAGQGLSFFAQLPLIGAAIPEVVGQFAPLIGILGGLAVVSPGVRNAFQSILQSLAPLAKSVASLVTDGLNILMPFFDQLGSAVGPLVVTLVRALADAFGRLDDLMTSPQMQDTLNQLAQSLLSISVAIQPLIPLLVLLTAELLIDFLRDVLPLITPLAQLATIIVQALAPGLQSLLQWLQPIIPLLAAALALTKAWQVAQVAITVATKAWAAASAIMVVATQAWTAAQTLLDIAMAADPIYLIIAAIIVLIGVTILIVTHWNQFRALVEQLASRITNLIERNTALANVIQAVGGPVAALITLSAELIAHWNQVVAVAGQVWSALQGLWSALMNLGNAFNNAFNAIVNFIFGRNWGALTFGIGTSMVQGIIDGISSMVGDAGSAIGSLVSGMISAAQRAGQGHSPFRLFAREIGVPAVQGIVQGIRQATPLALSAMGNVVNSMAGVSASGGGLGAPLGGTTINVNVAGTSASPDDIAQAISWALSHRGVMA
jgi:tape measure domain-containing protein